MADGASFTLKLIDKVSGPAKKADKWLGKSIGSLKRLRSRSGAAEKATGRFTDSLGRVRSVAKTAERATGRFTDALGRLREANGRFVGSRKGGLFGGKLFSGGALDVLKGNLLTAAASKVFGLAATAAAAGAEFITFGQNARLAFDQLKKHGASGEKLFEHSRALATRFGLDVLDTTKQYQKFLALQFDPKGADKLIKMGADLRVLGNSADDVKGVFVALGQIKSKGKFQAEEMLQLAERGISGQLVWEEIGKLLGGKSVDEVRKLQEQGKVGGELALEAIENAINRKLGQSTLGESGARYADTTIDGFIGRLKSRAQDTGLTVLDKIAAPVTKLLGGALTRLEGFLDSKEGAATMEKIATALGKAAEFATEFVGAFGEGFGETFKTLGKHLEPLFSSFSGPDGKAFVENIRTVGKTLGGIAATIGMFGASALGIEFTALGMTGEEKAKMDAKIASMKEGIKKSIGNLAGAAFDAAWPVLTAKVESQAVKLGKSLMMGIARGMGELAGLPFNTITGIASTLIEKAKGVFDSHSPSRVFAEIGASTGQGLAIGINQSARVAERAMGRMATASVGAASSLGSMTMGSPDLFGPVVSSVGAQPMLNTMQVGGGTSRIVVHLHQQIHGGGADAQEIAQISARESRREIEAFFRHLEEE